MTEHDGYDQYWDSGEASPTFDPLKLHPTHPRESGRSQSHPPASSSLPLRTRHVETVRELHILSADLLLHQRTLAPIKALVEGLRRYDRDRVAAVLDGSGAGLDKNRKVVGFMTHKTLMYLVASKFYSRPTMLRSGAQADVYEHLEYVLSQLDVNAGVGRIWWVIPFYNARFASLLPTEPSELGWLTPMYTYTDDLVRDERSRAASPSSPSSSSPPAPRGYFGMNFEIFWILQPGQGGLVMLPFFLPSSRPPPRLPHLRFTTHVN
ncbi:hypothetical protein B0H19DRAFT_1384868 [Mycena capillaripes]|nr:hypothetical protein B0H19DRAFT_1384868 [Mycena capillaripes]